MKFQRTITCLAMIFTFIVIDLTLDITGFDAEDIVFSESRSRDLANSIDYGLGQLVAKTDNIDRVFHTLSQKNKSDIQNEMSLFLENNGAICFEYIPDGTIGKCAYQSSLPYELTINDKDYRLGSSRKDLTSLIYSESYFNDKSGDKIAYTIASKINVANPNYTRILENHTRIIDNTIVMISDGGGDATDTLIKDLISNNALNTRTIIVDGYYVNRHERSGFSIITAIPTYDETFFPLARKVGFALSVIALSLLLFIGFDLVALYRLARENESRSTRIIRQVGTGTLCERDFEHVIKHDRKAIARAIAIDRQLYESNLRLTTHREEIFLKKVRDQVVGKFNYYYVLVVESTNIVDLSLIKGQPLTTSSLHNGLTFYLSEINGVSIEYVSDIDLRHIVILLGSSCLLSQQDLVPALNRTKDLAELMDVRFGFKKVKREDQIGLCTLEVLQDLEHSCDNIVKHSKALKQERLAVISKGLAIVDALTNNEVSIHFQPYLDVNTMRIMGLTSIISWDSKCYDSNKIAQYTRLNRNFNQLTERKISTVMLEARKFELMGNVCVRFPIGLTMNQLRSSSLLQSIREIQVMANVSPSMIEFSLDESVFLHADAKDLEKIRRLSDIGFGINIKDMTSLIFSTELWSQINITSVSVDSKLFIASDESLHQLKQLVSIVEDRGIRVIMQDVTNLKDSHKLKELGFTFVQGEFYQPYCEIDKIYQTLLSPDLNRRYRL